MKRFCSIALLLSVLFPGPLWAEEAEIIIQDTGGATRNTTSVQDLGNVEFSLTDAAGAPAEGAEITLTNQATGEILTTVSTNGVATFESVVPGIYTVASSSSTITFTGVVVTSSALAGTAVAGAVIGAPLLAAGGVAAAAGTTLAITESGGSSGGSDEPLSPFS